MPYDFHEAADIFPHMAEAEFEALKEDIATHGLREPIILHEGKILDGRHRYWACQVLRLEPWTKEWNDEGSPFDYVVSRNLHRRHLTESQRAMVAAKLKPKFEVEAKERLVTSTGGTDPQPSANLREADKGKASEKAAAVLNVSPRSVEAAAQVLKKGVPELKEAVEKGSVKVGAAAQVSRLPAEKQKEIVAKGPKEVKAAAKTIREEQPKGFAKLWEYIDQFVVSLPILGGIVTLFKEENYRRETIQSCYGKLENIQVRTAECMREMEEAYPWLDKT